MHSSRQFGESTLSLGVDLREILSACNRRYLAHLSALDDFSAGVRALDRLTKPRKLEGKTFKGINFFDPVDNALLHALQNPRVDIAGVRRADLAPLLHELSPSRLSRQLHRLREIGVIKKVAVPGCGPSFQFPLDLFFGCWHAAVRTRGRERPSQDNVRP